MNAALENFEHNPSDSGGKLNTLHYSPVSIALSAAEPLANGPAEKNELRRFGHHAIPFQAQRYHQNDSVIVGGKPGFGVPKQYPPP
jgi:hypothetical protein